MRTKTRDKNQENHCIHMCWLGIHAKTTPNPTGPPLSLEMKLYQMILVKDQKDIGILIDERMKIVEEQRVSNKKKAH